jgi:hypothetical protein
VAEAVAAKTASDGSFLGSQSCRILCVASIVLLASFRFAHVRLLWADEDYHLAAAFQWLHGRMPYRDFWYDKPPLNALYYALVGGYPGWPLRLLDVLYVLSACLLAFRFARAWWGEAEGWVAALLLAFFTTFYLPSAVIAFAADALMLLPHMAAMYCAYKRRPVASGLWCGVAFLVNAKALFVLAAALVWLWSGSLLILAAFAAVCVVWVLSAVLLGSWSGYVEQVWRWGAIYARSSPVEHIFFLGARRTADWMGFHAAIVLAAAFALFSVSRHDRRKLASWMLFSFGAACLGARFAPHYFLQLLPSVVIAAARGMTLAWQRSRRFTVAAVAVLLLVPAIRFGPRYFVLAYDDLLNRPIEWVDTNMDQDSQSAAAKLRSMAHAGDTLFVWGYRPDIYVYARLLPPAKFWDSQPLTGVPADRHLTMSAPIYAAEAAENRAALVHSEPTFLVDGLGPQNPALQPAAYPDLRPWLARYALVGRTTLCRIYKRISDGGPAPDIISRNGNSDTKHDGN